MAADFHIEDRGDRGIFLRAVSEAAHDWIANHQKPWHLVLGGALVQRPCVDEILGDIVRDDLVPVRVLPMMLKTF
jgi:hypothetical protein